MHVVIAGGGFGGLKTALELAEHKDFKITLISDRDHFLYYPALYSTATGHTHLESTVLIAKLIESYPNITFIQDSVEHLNVERKLITGKSGKSYQYDRLVLALGVVTTYFGIEGLAQHTFSIKSLDEIKRFKDHVHAEITDPSKAARTYVVVGAGPTGVELSAALATYLRRVSYSHGLSTRRIQIDLVEASPRVLPRMSPAASRIVENRLRKLAIRVMTNKKVEAATADAIQVSGKQIPSETVVWTSGVTNNPFFKNNEHCFHLAPNGRVEVDGSLRAAPHVYVIGDNAATPYSGLAQTALHDALFLAGNFKREVDRQPQKVYKAVTPPVVVPVGENWAIAEWHMLRLWGFPASLLRRAADFIGYNDVMRLGQALGVWRAQFVSEETCEVCQQAALHGPVQRS